MKTAGLGRVETVNVGGDQRYDGICRKAVRRKIGDSLQERWNAQNGTVCVSADPPDGSLCVG